jgi:hypothetical protein
MSTSFLTFLDRASAMIELGVPVVPLPPSKKSPPPKGWRDFATTDIETIKGWLISNGQPAIAFEDSNCACVATLTGVWFLDIDNMKAVSKQIEKDTGHKLQEIMTLVVRSSGEKRHLYFKQNDASRALGNVKYKDPDGAEMFSARVNGMYVVSPFSVHPDTGDEYEITRRMDIIEAPIWLTDWLKTAKRSSGEREEKLVADETTKISEGGRDDFLFAEACKLRDTKVSQKAALAALLVVNNDRCSPPLAESVVKIKIKSAYTRDARKKQNAETFVESGTSPTPTRPGEAPQGEINEPTIATVGTKDMPESVLDGWLGQICKSRMLEHFPVAYAWTALVTVASAMVPVNPKNGMRCNLFGCPVGPIHSGKSEAIKHAKLLLGIQSPPLLDLFAGSAEMLTSAVADANGRPRLYSTDELGHLLEKAQIQNSSFVYLLNRAFYETGFTVRSMEKKKKEVIFNAILSVIGGVVEERFGDLFTAKTTGGFYDRFLYGLCPTGFRYFYMPFEGGPALQISQTEDDPYSEAIVPIASVGDQPIPVALDKSVFVEANRWMREDDVLKNPDCERIVEIAMRVATICASFDRRPILYGKDLGPTLELARYQARIRHLLKPNPGKTFEGQLYHKFFEFLTMHTSDGSWMPRKELFHRTCSHEIGLPVANRTLDAMIANEDVEGLDQRGKSGPPKRLVRIARKTKVQS